MTNLVLLVGDKNFKNQIVTKKTYRNFRIEISLDQPHGSVHGGIPVAVAPHVPYFDGTARRIDSTPSAALFLDAAIRRVRFLNTRVHHPGGRQFGQGRLGRRHPVCVVVVQGRSGPFERYINVVGFLARIVGKVWVLLRSRLDCNKTKRTELITTIMFTQ